jgi:type I restriction enzyme R subunit
VSIKNSVTIDWDNKESVQAKIQVMIKKILKKYGYLPEKQDQAVKTILEQAKLIAADFLNNKQPTFSCKQTMRIV